jgi:putative tricarboxylic transport membrane protein
VGTFVGVLPGIGPTVAIALLLPATFKVTTTSSIIMLTGILYGAMYGGSTTSILVNIPGETASIVTCIDGYQMARQGRAGPALGMAAFSSFIAGTMSIVGLMFIANPLANAALRFGYPEYFALMCTGLIFVTCLAQGSALKGLMMVLVGILVGNIGLDMITGLPRFTFGIDELEDGVGIIPLVMGLFGITEVLENIEQELESKEIYRTRVRNLWPSLKDWAESKWAIARGALIGFCIGILPGGSATLSSFISYAVEKKVSKHPERFGRGTIEGVAGPEAANNASTGGCLIPLLSLGIPPNTTMAVLFSALLIHGIQPGPTLIAEHPDIFWGLVTSMYLGNVLLLLLNLPLIGLWVQVLRVPYRLLFPLVILFCLIGAHSVSGSPVDLTLLIVFGAIGYLMRKFRYEGTLLILGYVLGPLLERSLRQSLLISGGSFIIFINRPISGVTLAIASVLLLSYALPFVKRRRQKYETLSEARPTGGIRMKSYDQASSLFWLAVSISVLIGSLRMGMGTLRNPGMGFLAFGASGLLGILSLTLFLKTIWRKEESSVESIFANTFWKRIVLVLIILFAYAKLMPQAGYLVSTFILMTVLFWTVKGQKWWGVLTSSFLTTIITYYVFSRWLNIQFPEGLFGF